MKKEYYEAIIGEKDAGFFQISEEDIKRFFYFKPVGSSVTNIKELRQQQTAAAFQTAMSVPPEMRSNNVNPYTLDLHELEKEMFKAVDIQGIDRILIPLPSEEEVAEYQQQEAMKQQVSSFMNNVNQLRQVPYGGNNVTGV